MDEPVDQGGLRPLGLYGEGYCRHCHFIEPITQTGQLVVHYIGASMGTGQICKGGGKKPPSITPRESRKAAFKVVAPTGTCSVCTQSIVLLVDGRIGPHSPHVRTVDRCAGQYRAAVTRARQLATEPVNLNRNHSAERGA